MREHARLIPKLIEGKAAGAVVVFDASYDRLAGLYTFGVPVNHQLPTLYVDRMAGRSLVADAQQGKQATLRLIGTIEPTQTWQLLAWLPGRHYGTPQDQQIMFTTHTDGPSISQDDGGFGLLAVAEYFAKIPQADRPRTLTFFFDNRHYMPGAERAFQKQNWLEQHADARTRIVATMAWNTSDSWNLPSAARCSRRQAWWSTRACTPPTTIGSWRWPSRPSRTTASAG
jgi:hypothetical protein